MAPRPSLKLSVPPQNTDTLSFCAPEEFAQWVAELPMANVDEVAKHLYRAILEVTRLRCPLQERWDMVEHLRSRIHFTCFGLARRFLNQPVVNAQSRRYANQCQVLQNQLAIGYKVVVVQAIQEKVPIGPNATDDISALVPAATYRAIGELTMTLLRAYQLYTDPPPKLWLEMNQLALLAERTRIHDVPIEELADDETHGPFTVRQAYIRAALLATVSPNKLRQRQLSMLFEVLGNWAQYVDLEMLPADGTFVVDLASDESPIYEAAFDGPRDDACRSLNTDRLVSLIDRSMTQEESSLYIPNGVSNDLLSHAAGSWGKRVQRAFARSPMDGVLEICVGLSAAHYYLGDGRSFEDQLGRNRVFQTLKSNRFMDRSETIDPTVPKKDLWANAFDVGGARIPVNPEIDAPEHLLLPNDKRGTASQSDEYPIHSAAVVDTSPGGYCVRWSTEPPSGLQTGELLVVRENDEQRWALAAIRWMRHQSGEGTVMGMQLIAPVAMPVAFRPMSRGKSEQPYQRALLVPEMKILRQPAMIILPRIAIHDGQKIYLNQDGHEEKAQLQNIAAQTEAFAQYEYRKLDADAADIRMTSDDIDLFSDDESITLGP